MTTVAEHLTGRIEELEVVTKRLNRILLLSVCILGTGLLCSVGITLYVLSSAPDVSSAQDASTATVTQSVFQAEAIEIVSAEGKSLIRFGADEHGGLIELRDSVGTRMLEVSCLPGSTAGPGGVTVSLLDGAGVVRTEATSHLMAGVEVRGQSGQSAASLSEIVGIGTMVLHDDRGDPVVQLGEFPSANTRDSAFSTIRVLAGTDENKRVTLLEVGRDAYGGFVEVAHTDGQPVTALGASPTGGILALRGLDGNVLSAIAASEVGGSLFLRNAQGKDIVLAGVGGEVGDGALFISDRNGQRRVTLGGSPTVSGLAIYNDDNASVCHVVATPQGNGLVTVVSSDLKNAKSLKPE